MDRQEHLFDGKIKEIEQELIQFYIDYASNLGRNLKISTIFAYIAIHDELTQKQLKNSTQFSYSTISTGLAHLVQINVVKKSLIQGTHTYLYSLPETKYIPFNYQPRSNILERLNNLKAIIEQSVQECKQFSSSYPKKCRFFTYRMQGILNYIQAQKRNFSKKGQEMFLPENDASLFSPEEIIEYPEELAKIEAKIVSYLIDNQFLFDSNPLLSKMAAYVMFRKNVTQRLLQTLTGNSSGAVSQNLKRLEEKNLIKKLPFESPTTQRIFQIQYVSVNYMEFIIRDNRMILELTPKLQDLIKELTEDKKKFSSLQGYEHILRKMDQLLASIQEFAGAIDSFTQEKNLVLKYIEATG